MTTTTPTRVWVAYGADGRVVGTIRATEETYTVTMAGASAELGSYPTMEIAKSALHAHLAPGSDWPRFGEH